RQCQLDPDKGRQSSHSRRLSAEPVFRRQPDPGWFYSTKLKGPNGLSQLRVKNRSSEGQLAAMDFQNKTKLKAGWTMGFDRDGRELVIIAVKATFAFPQPG